MGDLDAALRLYLSTTRRANSALQAAVLGGSVPLLLLPPGYWVPGWFDRRSTAATRAFSSSSSRDQSCFGMEQLVQQLESMAHMAAQASGSRNGGGTTQSAAAAAAPGGVQQASEQLLAAAANVAATLLQQLDPSCAIAGSSKQPSRGPPLPGSSLSGSLDEVTGPGAAALQLPPPMIDLYKSWMAELSPRLRLKGLGAGIGARVGHFPGSTALLAAAGSSCGSSSSMAAVHIPAVPAQLQAAWQALQAAVAFCQRNTRPSSSTSASSSAAAAGGSSSSVAANAAQELWFQLMDVYVANLRSLHAHQQHQQQQGKAGQEAAIQQQQHGHPPQQQQERLVADLTRAASGQAPLQKLPSVLRAGAAAVAAGQALPGLLRLLLDEVVCSMADCLPLLDIVGRIIQQHGNERFGEFRWEQLLVMLQHRQGARF